MKTILVKGAYGESNFGDDVLMCVLDEYFQINFPDHKVYFLAKKIDSYMEKLLRYGTAITIDSALLLKIDLIAYGGGTQFFSFKKDAGFIRGKIDNLVYILKYDYSGLRSILRNKMPWRKKTGLASEKAAAIGIGIGPFIPGSESALKASRVLGRFDFLAVRDAVSLGYCNSWSITSTILGADICFSDYFIHRFVYPLKKALNSSAKKKIGIIVRDWTQDNEGAKFYDPLMKTVNELSARFDFTYIVFAPDRDKGWIDKLGGSNVLLWTPKENSIFDFLSILNDFDGVVTSRYHGAVFSAVMNKPTICIEIEPKLKILTGQIPELVLWEKPFNPSVLSDYIVSFLNSNTSYNSSIGILNRKANTMFDQFTKYVDGV